MWRVPFWLLIAGSCVASLLLVGRIIVNRDIRHERQVLYASQQEVARSATYKNAWKQLAGGIYRASLRDKALAELLKRHDITVNVAQPPAPASVPAKNSSVTPPPSSPPGTSTLPAPAAAP
jgi:hypothetical protein